MTEQSEVITSNNVRQNQTISGLERRMSSSAVNKPISGFKPPDGFDSWCTTTEGEGIRHKHGWTVENFSKEMTRDPGTSLYSSMFSFLGPDKTLTKWELEIYPNGQNKEREGNVGIFLINCTGTEVTVNYSISIQDSNSALRYSKRETSVKFRSQGQSESSWGYKGLVNHEQLKGSADILLPQDNLTIVCEISLNGSETRRNIWGLKKLPETQETGSAKNKNLKPNFEFDFNDKEFSDIKIVCGDKVFDCHRNILSSRSPVFRAMFRNQMAERQTGRVDIKELKQNVCQAMLEYIYTGKTDVANVTTDELLKVANRYDHIFSQVYIYIILYLNYIDRFDLTALKIDCEEKLCESLEFSNCIDYLVLGDLHHAVKLKREALELIVMNRSSIVKTADWKEKLIPHPVLMAEVLESVAEDPEPPERKKRKLMSSYEKSRYAEHDSEPESSGEYSEQERDSEPESNGEYSEQEHDREPGSSEDE